MKAKSEICLDQMILPQNALTLTKAQLVQIAKPYQELFAKLQSQLVKEFPLLVEQTQFTQVVEIYQSLSTEKKAQILFHPAFNHWLGRVNNLIATPNRSDLDRRILERLAELSRFVIIPYLSQHPQVHLNCFLRVNRDGQIRFPEHPFYLDFGAAFENQMLELVARNSMLSFSQNRELIFQLPVDHLLHGSEINYIAGQPDFLSLVATQELMPDLTMFPIVLGDISTFTGEDLLTIQEKTLQYVDLTKEEWLGKNPTTWDEKTAFYEQTSSYIYELTEWHRRDPINKLLLSMRSEGTALDYGGGTATLSLLGHLQGKSIHVYDISSVTFEFAKSRLKYHGIEQLICETPKREAYDTVICVDVLEHVTDPMRMLKDLKQLLKPGGLLIANAAGLPELAHSHPMHEFVTNDDIERIVKQLGFTDIDRYHFNVVARK